MIQRKNDPDMQIDPTQFQPWCILHRYSTFCISPANGLLTVSLADLFLSSIIVPPSIAPSKATLLSDYQPKFLHKLMLLLICIQINA